MATQQPCLFEEAEADAHAGVVVAQLTHQIVQRREDEAPNAALFDGHAVDAAQVFDGQGIAVGVACKPSFVAGGVKEDAVGRFAVAPGAACFLIIGFQRVGQTKVDDKADVGFVDAHAEGNGGDDHTHVATHEAILYAGAIRNTGVVVDGVDAMADEQRGQFLTVAAGAGVDDAVAFQRRAEVDELGVFAVFVGHVDGGQAQVGAEAVQRHDLQAARRLAVFAHAEKLAFNVTAHLGGRSGSERKDGRRSQAAVGVGDGEVVGAEVVSPGGDAVGFVDDEAGDAATLQCVQKGPLAQPFRRGIDKPIAPCRQIVDGLGHAFAVHAAVDGDGLGAQGGGQVVHLIFHEGDEGRYDQGEAAVEQGGQLVAERLARSGGKDGEDVFATPCCGHHLGLSTAQAVEAKILLYSGGEIRFFLRGDGDGAQIRHGWGGLGRGARFGLLRIANGGLRIAWRRRFDVVEQVAQSGDFFVLALDDERPGFFDAVDVAQQGEEITGLAHFQGRKRVLAFVDGKCLYGVGGGGDTVPAAVGDVGEAEAGRAAARRKLPMTQEGTFGGIDVILGQVDLSAQAPGGSVVALDLAFDWGFRFVKAPGRKQTARHQQQCRLRFALRQASFHHRYRFGGASQAEQRLGFVVLKGDVAFYVQLAQADQCLGVRFPAQQRTDQPVARLRGQVRNVVGCEFEGGEG